MFKSKRRPIVVPQYEHAKLAGAMALHWGNPQFDKPAFDFSSFVVGVNFHDWGYGLIDNYAIGEGSEEDWLKIQRHGVEVQSFDDPIAAIVSKLHIRRLSDRSDKPLRKELVARIDADVERRLPESGHSLQDFLWADRLTNLCDMVAFDFSFETHGRRSMAVFAKLDDPNPTEIIVSIKPNGDIAVAPWPFRLSRFEGFIIGYQEDGYPERREPVLLPYCFDQSFVLEEES